MPVSDWYEEAMERYRAAGLVTEEGKAPQEATGTTVATVGMDGDAAPHAAPDIPDWVARAMDRYQGFESDAQPSRLMELGKDAPGAGAPAPPPKSGPEGRRMAAALAGIAGALALMGGGAGIYLAAAPSSSASAALSQALTTSLSSRTADMTMSTTAEFEGQSYTFSGQGGVNLTNNQADMTAQETIAGRTISMRFVYDGQTEFVNVGSVIGSLFPGKSWVSLATGQLWSSSGNTVPTGADGNPTAMLDVLRAQGITVTSSGPTTLNGSSVHEFTVQLTPAELKSAGAKEHLPNWLQQAMHLMQDTSMTMRVDVGPSNELVRVSASMTATMQGHTLTEQIDEDYSHYGAPVTITDPPATQIVPFDQFVQRAAASAPAS